MLYHLYEYCMRKMHKNTFLITLDTYQSFTNWILIWAVNWIKTETEFRQVPLYRLVAVAVELFIVALSNNNYSDFFAAMHTHTEYLSIQTMCLGARAHTHTRYKLKLEKKKRHALNDNGLSNLWSAQHMRASVMCFLCVCCLRCVGLVHMRSILISEITSPYDGSSAVSLSRI